MKLLTKEQEQEHYNETLKGGFIGGFAGLGLGSAAVVLASRRSHFFRGLTIPLRAFLITSAGTFSGIVTADHWSRAYEKANNPKDQEYAQRERDKYAKETEGKTFTERAMEWGKQERYKIVAGSWIASMIAAFTLVNRNKFLTGQQKLVQARVYAQFLTLGVLVASAAFEINDKNNETGRYETVRYVDPSDPEHKRMLERQQEKPPEDSGDELWKDMVKAEEQRLKEREEEEKRMRAKEGKKNGGGKKGKGKEKDEGKKEGKDEGKKEDKSEGKKDDKSESKDDGAKKEESKGGDKKEEKEDKGKKDEGKKDKK